METSLRRVQRGDRAVLGEARSEAMEDRVVANMVEGYAFVDALVTGAVDLFALGQSRDFLELNALVLCGTASERRRAFAGHLEATEERFYGEREGGIQDLVEWYARHQGEPVWNRAAGAYVRLLSAPQLFIEGNHRTGALVMSYILLRDGQPPFVLSAENAVVYLESSRAIREIARRSAAMLFRGPVLARRLTAMLREHAEDRYLV